PPQATGWAIHVTDDHRSGPDAPGQTITIAGGGLATSSTTARRWLLGGRVMHHILDPATGEPVRPVWRTATVAASSCLDANIATTAALVQGQSAVGWLRELRLPSRLVSVAGEVHAVAGWPAHPPERPPGALPDRPLRRPTAAPPDRPTAAPPDRPPGAPAGRQP
ncbi:MAG TPA: FAD:protein FMN transferase, partial [Solirubrobacteraceae bacterium]|nr:FAD:protein FMN transferase [Solirubrobacteraceae bacterium]